MFTVDTIRVHPDTRPHIAQEILEGIFGELRVFTTSFGSDEGWYMLLIRSQFLPNEIIRA